jgi:leucyl/phenylalanyl-tRNA---protein transferase
VPVYQLDDDLWLPRPELADPSGILAVGGDLRPERLLLAYANGIFPWYEEGLPILWHSPDPRWVITLESLHIPRSVRKAQKRFTIRFDTDFRSVMNGCAYTARKDQTSTWITPAVIDAYCELHRLGFAHSAEAWHDGELAGGLYGVALGGVFFGESMFARAADASKVAFATLCDHLPGFGIDLIDCQVHTPHMERFGAQGWPRDRFLAALGERMQRPTKRGQWQLHSDA